MSSIDGLGDYGGFRIDAVARLEAKGILCLSLGDF